jgi:hypothetical protein
MLNTAKERRRLRVFRSSDGLRGTAVAGVSFFTIF